MKYKHVPETVIVLDDLQNRIEQLVEASKLSSLNEISDPQIMAFQAVLTLIDQIRRTGHVFRGSSAVPDGLEPYFKTPSYNNPLKVKALKENK